MTTVVDTSVLIDVLRGDERARKVLRSAFTEGPVHANEVTRLEVLAGMRVPEEPMTRRLLESLSWHPLDATIAEIAGDLARRWRPGNAGIDTPDLAIAATVQLLNARLLTRNVRHFPMFEDLTAPY